MSDIVRIVTNPRRGRAVAYNGVIYLGGQTASRKDDDIRGQTQQALAKIDEALDKAGTTRSRLLTAQIWLRDISRDFAGFNEVWDAWVDPVHAPTRATAQCAMAHPETLIEIIVTAGVAG